MAAFCYDYFKFSVRSETCIPFRCVLRKVNFSKLYLHCKTSKCKFKYIPCISLKLPSCYITYRVLCFYIVDGIFIFRIRAYHKYIILSLNHCSPVLSVLLFSFPVCHRPPVSHNNTVKSPFFSENRCAKIIIS